MNFLYPNFLYALLAVLIPIIVHLFNFRSYRTVYFSNVSFLKNIKQETKAKSELKHLLVLLARILAIVAVVLAFAQPYIPLKNSVKQVDNEVVSIYIDNSFSMDAESAGGKLLEVAKNKARRILDAFPPTTKYLLITNDFEAKHQHLLSKEQILDYIAELQSTASVKNLSTVFSRQKDILLPELAKTTNKTQATVFLISDFQKNTSDFSLLKNDTILQVNLMKLEANPVNNLYIDSCWFETPGRKYRQPEELFVKIVNKSDEAYQNIPIKLSLNDSVKAIADFNVEAQSQKTLSLNYTNTHKGIVSAKLEITDYPIVYDNTFFFSYPISQKIKVLSINSNENSKYWNALFGDDSYMDLSNFDENNIHASEFSNFHFIILSELKSFSSGLQQKLLEYVAEGGTLVFFPHPEGDIENYNLFFNELKTNTITEFSDKKTKVSQLNFQNPIYANVFKKISKNLDLPDIYKYFRFTKHTQNSEEAIFTAANGDAILKMLPYEKGKVYISAVPISLKYSNLVKHSIFVPTFYNMALYSQNVFEIYHTIGNNELIRIKSIRREDATEVFHLKDKAGRYDFIPQQQVSADGAHLLLDVQNRIKKAGNYFLTHKKSTVYGFSFNYDRSESDLSYFSTEDLQEAIINNNFNNFNQLDTKTEFLAENLKKLKHGKQFWKWFIVLALIFLAAEVVLIRFWKP